VRVSERCTDVCVMHQAWHWSALSACCLCAGRSAQMLRRVCDNLEREDLWSSAPFDCLDLLALFLSAGQLSGFRRRRAAGFIREDLHRLIETARLASSRETRAGRRGGAESARGCGISRHGRATLLDRASLRARTGGGGRPRQRSSRLSLVALTSRYRAASPAALLTSSRHVDIVVVVLVIDLDDLAHLTLRTEGSIADRGCRDQVGSGIASDMMRHKEAQ
jgi:hypothetical protein